MKTLNQLDTPKYTYTVMCLCIFLIITAIIVFYIYDCMQSLKERLKNSEKYKKEIKEMQADTAASIAHIKNFDLVIAQSQAEELETIANIAKEKKSMERYIKRIDDRKKFKELCNNNTGESTLKIFEVGKLTELEGDPRDRNPVLDPKNTQKNN